MKKKTISKSKFERVKNHPKACWEDAYVTDDFAKYVRSFFLQDCGGRFLYAHILEVKPSTGPNEYWCRIDMRTLF